MHLLLMQFLLAAVNPTMVLPAPGIAGLQLPPKVLNSGFLHTAMQPIDTVVIPLKLCQHNLTTLCNEHPVQLGHPGNCPATTHVFNPTQGITTAAKRPKTVFAVPTSIPTCLLFNVEAPVVDLLLWRIWYVTLEFMLHRNVLLLCHFYTQQDKLKLHGGLLLEARER